MTEYLSIAIPLGSIAILGLGFMLATIDLTDAGESRTVAALEQALATVVGLPARAAALITSRSR